jgi:hypothetical protein
MMYFSTTAIKFLRTGTLYYNSVAQGGALYGLHYIKLFTIFKSPYLGNTSVGIIYPVVGNRILFPVDVLIGPT